METNQMAINGWMDKQIMMHTYNRILSNHKKKYITDTCYNLEEAQKYYAK